MATNAPCAARNFVRHRAVLHQGQAIGAVDVRARRRVIEALASLAVTVAAIVAEGGAIEAAYVDARDTATIDALVDGAVARHGKIDIGINATGWERLFAALTN